MTIAICEDEPYFLTTLYRMVDGYLNKKQVNANIITFASGEELLSFEKKRILF